MEAELPMAADTNNNMNMEKCEKYSLRPRAVPKREDEEFEAWKPRSKCKKRVKQKPAPLSKYRRKTANARERCRMREINEGFEALRRVLPHLTAEKDSNEKLTKISTLRLAMKYITALNRILQDTTDVESDGESSFFTDVSDHSSLTPPAFSDHHSFCTDFSDQLLSPSDFTDSILPGASSDLDITSTLPLANDFNLSDFVVSSSSSSSSSLSSSSSTSSDMNPLDGCSLPELHFDDTRLHSNLCSSVSLTPCARSCCPKSGKMSITRPQTILSHLKMSHRASFWALLISQCIGNILLD